MGKLLYIKASPRKDRSYSTRVAEAFLESYKKAHPDDTVETLDLWELDIPEFDHMAAEGKYKVMGGKPHTEEEAKAWEKVVKITEHFKSFDNHRYSR